MKLHQISSLAVAASLVAFAAPAHAQAQPSQSASAASDGEILVTARKRTESLISVPVVISAIPTVELERRAVNNLDGIARLVPQLIIAPSNGSVQGGNMSIRGIAGPDTNPFGDQAVSFNIDGFQISKSFVRRMTDVDLEQIEVLKGPQALFYGKNSPAGIVSIRTADPTQSLEAKVTAGYEFVAREVRTTGYVAGPLSETLGFRVAGTYSHMQGYFKEQTPPTAPFNYDPKHDRSPRSDSFAVRGTLKWEPTDAFSARLKLNYAKVKDAGPKMTSQFISCPSGVRSTGSDAQCKPGKYKTHSTSGPVVGTLGGQLNSFGDGENFAHQKQFLGSLELGYALSDQVQLTSVTGYYSVKLRQCQNYENDYAIILPSCNPTTDKEFSQELRLNTDYDGPLNFAGGLYYAQTNAVSGSITYLFGGNFDLFGPGVAGPTTPFLVNNYNLRQKGKAYSAYLQLIYKPIEQVEIDVGGRYSNETKRVPMVRSDTASVNLDRADEIEVARRKRKFNDFSPEVTVSYRPSQHLTLFSSYKHGFLSGGFNSSSTAFFDGVDISYEPETIKGFEAGVKAETEDRSLRANFAVYTYKVKNLQITGFVNASATINNAGAVKTKGAEFDFDYRTPVEGLSVNGAISYNDAKYTSFKSATCWNGQTPAMGCNIIDGVAMQDLSGTRLIRAPKWSMNAGFNYETALAEGLKMGLSGNVSHTSSLLTDDSSDPLGKMKAYSLIDANLRVADADDTWELAVIGRNLTNKYYWTGSNNVPFTGTPGGTADAVLGDRDAALSRGREVMLRVSYKFK